MARGEKIIIVGPMGARKTAWWNWYMRTRGQEYANPKKSLAFKPIFDDRYATGVALTHDENNVITYINDKIPEFLAHILPEFIMGTYGNETVRESIASEIARSLRDEEGTLRKSFEEYIITSKEGGNLGGVLAEPCRYTSEAIGKIEEFVEQNGKLPDTVGFAEYNFWDRPIKYLVDDLVDEGVDVIVEGLPESFRGEPFYVREEGTDFRNVEIEGMDVVEYDPSNHHIMELATSDATLHQLTASCQHVVAQNGGDPYVCGKPATKTQRWMTKDGVFVPAHYDSPVIMLGPVGDNPIGVKYGPVCREDHIVPGIPPKSNFSLESILATYTERDRL